MPFTRAGLNRPRPSRLRNRRKHPLTVGEHLSVCHGLLASRAVFARLARPPWPSMGHGVSVDEVANVCPKGDPMLRNSRLQTVAVLAVGALGGWLAASGRLQTPPRADAAPPTPTVTTATTTALCCDGAE